ncbi:hypothetical protein [Coleofasciculus sp. FACHB-129]|uniref:hypothetical protein n=1 Tax=Cyanophyceae TaxID=3028117 RepID=UPI001685F1DF|nr:hypothetical protein [Coleofasciculus sp. FACHB-129]MBD1895896.1 hypothetical protein [Coleofasciculus sp. FACHB-129]
MHPIELMRKHHWSYLELALQMGVSEAAVRKWAMSRTASNFRNPPPMAFVLADKLDREFSIKVS